MNESCHVMNVHVSQMASKAMSHMVSNIESRHAYNKSLQIYEWVKSHTQWVITHIYMSHVTHIHVSHMVSKVMTPMVSNIESRHAYNESLQVYEWVTSHMVGVSLKKHNHCTHMHESCHTYNESLQVQVHQWVMSHMLWVFLKKAHGFNALASVHGRNSQKTARY